MRHLLHFKPLIGIQSQEQDNLQPQYSDCLLHFCIPFMVIPCEQEDATDTVRKV